MSYLTRSLARAYGLPLSTLTASASLEWERQRASGPFDIFLSHAYVDAEEVLGVKRLLERQGFTVYVDWLVDPHLPRGKVTPETANLLRNRMNESRSMVFVVTPNSGESRWMPWELGYFDGRSNGRIAILPLVERDGDSFVGREYLGLYPLVADLDPTFGTSRFRISATTAGPPLTRLGSLRTFVNSA